MVTIKYDNQGDAISRDVPRDGAGPDRRRRQRQRTALQLRRHLPAERRRGARPAEARPQARRPRGYPVGQSRGIPAHLPRHHAGRHGLGAGELQAAGRDRGLHRRGLRRQAGDRRRSRGWRLRPTACRKISFDTDFAAFLDEGPFTPLKMKPGGTGDVPLHLGLDRPAQGRGAVALFASLGDQPARAPAGPARPALAGGGAALSHERPGDVPDHLHQGDTIVLLPQFTTTGYIEAAASTSRGLPDLGADHDRHAAARDASCWPTTTSPPSRRCAWARRRSPSR